MKQHESLLEVDPLSWKLWVRPADTDKEHKRTMEKVVDDEGDARAVLDVLGPGGDVKGAVGAALKSRKYAFLDLKEIKGWRKIPNEVALV